MSGGAVSDYRYTGQRQESLGNNWIYDYGARFYDALIGRFLSADTIVPGAGNPQALNRYAYSHNNPLKYTDPSGHCPPRDDECWELQWQTEAAYGFKLNGDWRKDEISALQDALAKMAAAIAGQILGGDARLLRAIMWNTRTLTRVRLDHPNYSAFADPLTGDITFWNGTFQQSYADILWTIAHEFGHSMDAWNGLPGHAQGSNTVLTFIFLSPFPWRCSLFGNCPGNEFPSDAKEDWASSFAAFVFPDAPLTRRIYSPAQIAARREFVGLQVNLMLQTLFRIVPQIFPYDVIPPPPYPTG